MIAEDDGDADGVDVGIEKVIAAAFGFHAQIVNHGGLRGFCDIFADEREAPAGVGCASGEVGLSRRLVEDVVAIGHLTGVIEGCLGENRVKAQFGKAACRAVVIGSGEEVPLFAAPVADDCSDAKLTSPAVTRNIMLLRMLVRAVA